MIPSSEATESHAAEESILHMRDRTHIAIIAALLIASEVGVFWFAPDGWSVLRAALGGVVVALGVYVCLFINRIIVSAADDW